MHTVTTCSCLKQKSHTFDNLTSIVIGIEIAVHHHLIMKERLKILTVLDHFVLATLHDYFQIFVAIT